MYDSERLKHKNIIYVCSQLRGDIAKNQKKSCKYCRFVISKGQIPVAVHLMFPRFMNDDNESDRSKAIMMGLDILARCDELWCFGEEISKGMLVELMFAREYMIKIKRFTEDCKFISNRGVIGNGE